MADIRCGNCFATFPEATLKDKAKPVRLPDDMGIEQKETRCLNPGCNAVVYREVKGQLQVRPGEFVDIDGRVPCDPAQEKDMVSKGKWKTLGQPVEPPA